MRLIGYCPDSKAYRLYHRSTGKVSTSYHVSFVESHQDTNPPSPQLPECRVVNVPVPNTPTAPPQTEVTPPPLRRSFRVPANATAAKACAALLA